MELEPIVETPLTEEALILEGLKNAVQAGRITEDDKQQWLNSYIESKLAVIGLKHGV